MTWLFASGRIVDLILVVVALEAVALLLWRRRRGNGPAPLSLAANLASGAFLMLAVRAALTAADWTVVAGCLLGAGLAHLADLHLRARGMVPEADRRTSQTGEAGTSTDTAAFTARHKSGMISPRI